MVTYPPKGPPTNKVTYLQKGNAQEKPTYLQKDAIGILQGYIPATYLFHTMGSQVDRGGLPKLGAGEGGAQSKGERYVGKALYGRAEEAPVSG